MSPLAPPLWAALGAGLLYARGCRRQLQVVAPSRRAALLWRTAAFYAALVTLAAALDSPIDQQADRLFWVHMVQHVLLMMVAAPLLVASAPWIPIWKGLSLGLRRRLGRSYVHSPGWRQIRAAGRALGSPVPAFILFNADLCAWHIPFLYGLTLRHQAVHDLEHLSFLLLGLLFWLQAVESPPLRPRLGIARRVAYVTLGATVAWALAVVLALAPSPLYRGYATLASRPDGLSALADQHIAAGIMWGPGSIPYALFVFLALYRWLAPGGRPGVSDCPSASANPGPRALSGGRSWPDPSAPS